MRGARSGFLACVLALALMACAAGVPARVHFDDREAPLVSLALCHLAGRASPPEHGPGKPWQVTTVRIYHEGTLGKVHIESYDAVAQDWQARDVYLQRQAGTWRVVAVQAGSLRE